MLENISFFPNHWFSVDFFCCSQFGLFSTSFSRHYNNCRTVCSKTSLSTSCIIRGIIIIVIKIQRKTFPWVHGFFYPPFFDYDFFSPENVVTFLVEFTQHPVSHPATPEIHCNCHFGAINVHTGSAWVGWGGGVWGTSIKVSTFSRIIISKGNRNSFASFLFKVHFNIMPGLCLSFIIIIGVSMVGISHTSSFKMGR